MEKIYENFKLVVEVKNVNFGVENCLENFVVYLVIDVESFVMWKKKYFLDLIAGK
jgi:hypothetical protein